MEEILKTKGYKLASYSDANYFLSIIYWSDEKELEYTYKHEKYSFNTTYMRMQIEILVPSKLSKKTYAITKDDIKLFRYIGVTVYDDKETRLDAYYRLIDDFAKYVPDKTIKSEE